MDIKKLADVKDRFADYEKIFNSGDYDKAADILSAILERIPPFTAPALPSPSSPYCRRRARRFPHISAATCQRAR